MSSWVSKSFDLVARGDYLDRLSVIYDEPAIRAGKLSKASREQLVEAWGAGDRQRVFEVLLSLERRPFNDPFFGMLVCSRELMLTNPKTMDRLWQKLERLEIDKIVENIEAPPEFNRQMGSLFSRWLKGKFQFVKDEKEFLSSQSGTCFLQASGKKLKQVANQLDFATAKEPDLVVRVGKKFLIGEAKFFGSEGGNQNRGFDDAMKMLAIQSRKVSGIAVIDGIPWIRGSGQMSDKVQHRSDFVLSALLLDDFLASL
jgi:Tsp45I type II restriction enzyme